MVQINQLFFYFTLSILIALLIVTRVGAFNPQHHHLHSKVNHHEEHRTEADKGQPRDKTNNRDDTDNGGDNDNINTHKPCEGCQDSNPDQEDLMKLMRIEKIKQRILHKLRLKTRPTVGISRDAIPSPLSHGEVIHFNSNPGSQPRPKEDYYGRTDQVIIFPDNDSHPCIRHHRYKHAVECLHFSQITSFTDGEVATAELWVFKMPDDRDDSNQTFMIADPDHGIDKRIYIDRQETSLASGWLKFNVKDAVTRWLIQRQRSHHYHYRKDHHKPDRHWLDVMCTTCSKGKVESPISMEPGHLPFLIMSMDHSRQNSRNRRNPDCDPERTQCCKETLYISFSEIGWDDWILEPKGYTANYCRGSCIEDVAIPLSRNHHTTVIQRYIQNKSLTPSQQINLTPCCTPTHMSEISLLYIDEDKKIYQKNLPDMVVDSCGCS